MEVQDITTTDLHRGFMWTTAAQPEVVLASVPILQSIGLPGALGANPNLKARTVEGDIVDTEVVVIVRWHSVVVARGKHGD